MDALYKTVPLNRSISSTLHKHSAIQNSTINTPPHAHFDLFFARWYYALLAHSVLLSVLQLQTFFGYTAGVHIHSAITLSQVRVSLVISVQYLTTVCFIFKPQRLTGYLEPHSLTKVVVVLPVCPLLRSVQPKRILYFDFESPPRSLCRSALRTRWRSCSRCVAPPRSPPSRLTSFQTRRLSKACGYLISLHFTSPPIPSGL